jgi:hypothetical protein
MISHLIKKHLIKDFSEVFILCCSVAVTISPTLHTLNNYILYHGTTLKDAAACCLKIVSIICKNLMIKLLHMSMLTVKERKTKKEHRHVHSYIPSTFMHIRDHSQKTSNFREEGGLWILDTLRLCHILSRTIFGQAWDGLKMLIFTGRLLRIFP